MTHDDASVHIDIDRFEQRLDEPAEFTSTEELEAGANVLLHTMLALAQEDVNH